MQKRESLLSYLRPGAKTTESQTSWPMLPQRVTPSALEKDPDWQTLGERGPITPVDEELFRETPELYAGDARFVEYIK